MRRVNRMQPLHGWAIRVGTYAENMPFVGYGNLMRGRGPEFHGKLSISFHNDQVQWLRQVRL